MSFQGVRRYYDIVLGGIPKIPYTVIFSSNRFKGILISKYTAYVDIGAMWEAKHQVLEFKVMC